MQKAIMLIGSFSGDNYGDTIILTSLLEYLEEKGFTKVYIPAANPQRTKDLIADRNKKLSIHCIDVNMRRTFGYRFFNKNVIKVLKNVDYIAFTAGTIFIRDLLKPRRNFIFSVYLLHFFLKLRRVKTIGLFVGINESLHKFTGIKGLFVRRFFKNFEHLVTRDQKSYENIRSQFPALKLSRSYDIAFYNLLKKAVHIPSKIQNIDGLERNIIGVNVCEYLGAQVGQNVEIKDLITFLEKISSRYTSILWFNTTKKDELFVQNEILAQSELMKKKSVNLSLYKELVLEDEYLHLDFFVGMRMHSLIPAIAYKVPSVALNYNDKVKSLFAQLGGDRFVIDFEELKSLDALGRVENGFAISDDTRHLIIKNVDDIEI